ncbi:OsmC family protein [Luteitalea sp. TBR-22]|uniref:OsmC family protein n=1 Tax=Luteitalea sp. TBR-22 TaxID=2802971 RepID=UPI001EF56FF0|nr:OsmC family protein [Luteitalea sp. TBR-22]
MAKTLEVSLTWNHDQVFDTHLATGSGPVLDGDGAEGASPTQAVALALGACMGIDVVSILKKGRHDLRALRVKVTGTRADGPPSYFTGWILHYEITGPVPDAAIERAIALSRDTYCSVWHSLRRDAPLEVTYTRVDG